MINELKKLSFFLNEDNRVALVQEMQRMQREYGAKWLAEFKSQFPDFVVVVDLIANHNETDALLKFKALLCNLVESADIAELKSHFPIPHFVGKFLTDDIIKTFAINHANELVDANRLTLVNLHRDLRAEIDKPRF